jgi:hypothetical protein
MARSTLRYVLPFAGLLVTGCAGSMVTHMCGRSLVARKKRSRRTTTDVCNKPPRGGNPRT